MSGHSGRERRVAERLPIRCEVAFRALRDGAKAPIRVAAETLNLSASGLCLVSPSPLERDGHLALELTLEGHADPVVAVGKVVWCDAEKTGYRAGICFTWLREEDRKALSVISDFVAERLRH